MINNLIATGKPQYYDMIVFCHLRWQFVYQRPQHIISRLASGMKVLFIEEPIHKDQDNNTAENLLVITEKLHVLQPFVKDIESIIAILPIYIKNKTIPIGWFYSASFSPLLEQINFETIIYDCMDELIMIGPLAKIEDALQACYIFQAVKKEQPIALQIMHCGFYPDILQLVVFPLRSMKHIKINLTAVLMFVSQSLLP